MGRDAEQVLDAAMKLSDGERAEIAAILGDSFGDGYAQEDIDAAWLEEAKSRLQRVRFGGEEIVASEQVEGELERIIAEHETSYAAGQG